MRAILAGLIVFAGVSGADAVDITACGQTISAGETGVLQADLDCSGQPAGTEGVGIERNGTLDLGGHTLVGPPLQANGKFGFAVRCRLGTVCSPGFVCRGHGKCTVISTSGTGHVDAGGIVSEHDLVVSHIALGGGFVAADDGRLTATDVSVSGGGLTARTIRVLDVSVDGAPHFGVYGLKRVSGGSLTVTNSALAGVAAERVVLDGLVATGNGAQDYDGGGVFAGSCALRNSTVTGNVINEDDTLYPVDLFTRRRPRLDATACDKSGVLGDATVPTPTGTWGVCSLD